MIFQTLKGVEVFKNLVPIHESFKTIGDITIILAGAFPLVFFLQHVLKKPFEKAGNKIGLTHQSLVGLLSSLACHVPDVLKVRPFDARGKVINTAFAVSGSFVMGSHLDFVAPVVKSLIVPVIFGKLTAGILAEFIFCYE
ncbi:ethanolamine utilization protein EutH [Cytobacillus firmus]|uniref:Ethanolamine utilization protein EutH n=2 Tax=Cytobacillus TaxID=2675230 RepID=A0A366K403_CYTFI|nr:ethanolamine utilization protein EutH [Cytobacillus firmus]TDX44910.1 ethanolamine utilization protein EutH [Cytobacillus oceanisediminis]